MSYEQRLRDLGIELPTPSTPGANYVQFVRTGNLIFLTGQLSQWNGERRFIGNGASDLFVEIFGEAGRHTRMAIGVSALPYDVAVEVEAVFEAAADG